MTAFHALTAAQRRMIVAGHAADSTPLRVTMRDRCTHDLILQAVAQEERKESDQYSTKGSLVVARFYATPQVLVLRLADIWTLEPLALNVTDPNHPDFVEERKVVNPIPREALASRKVAGDNRHAQR